MTRHRPRKRFGQHFLQDQQVIQQIIDSLRITQQDSWVEIGPGQGALTDLMAARTNSLCLIEIDRDLSASLGERYKNCHHVKVINEDILAFDLTAVMPRKGRVRLLGNLPYNISTPIFFHLAEKVELINDMTFMLQKEVAERLMATAGSKAYGRLTLSAGLRFSTDRLFDVGKNAFNPPPKVESSVVRMTPHPQQVDKQLAAKYDLLVKTAFSKRRKTLRNSLEGVLGAREYSEAEISPGLRAEALTINDFLKLARQLL